MNTMITEALKSSMAELEEAAYLDLAKSNSFAEPDFLDGDFMSFSRGVAAGPWCMETTRALLPKAAQVAGRPVRREYHEDAFPDHCFLSIPVLGEHTLAACDIIIDPTYLQFARTEVVESSNYPNIFIGSRLEAFVLMQTADFQTENTVPEFYLASTLKELNSAR